MRPVQTRPRVLVVDDDHEVLIAFERFLRTMPVDVRTARSGLEALQVLEREPIAVLVTDQVMPGISGEDLLLVVARRWPETRRILVTGYWVPQLSGDAAAHITLQKPVSERTLRLQVEWELRRGSQEGHMAPRRPAGVGRPGTRSRADQELHDAWGCGSREA